jgi:hypothetical protein
MGDHEVSRPINEPIANNSPRIAEYAIRLSRKSLSDLNRSIHSHFNRRNHCGLRFESPNLGLPNNSHVAPWCVSKRLSRITVSMKFAASVAIQRGNQIPITIKDPT